MASATLYRRNVRPIQLVLFVCLDVVVVVAADAGTIIAIALITVCLGNRVSIERVSLFELVRVGNSIRVLEMRRGNES